MSSTLALPLARTPIRPPRERPSQESRIPAFSNPRMIMKELDDAE